jgi:LysM repeat protein
VSSISDYYPFGAPIKGRSFSSAEYRFGYNTQEKDDEVNGTGNHNTAQFWEYDSRLGRRWNLDPVVKPWESLYACLSDNPILLNDPDGDDPGNPKRYIVVGGDDLTKIGNKYGVSVDNLVKWNNIPKRNEIEIGQSLIVSDPTKVKEPEEFVWFNSANSTFSQPKTVKDPEEYLWWASGNSPRTNSPIINQPFNPLSTTVSNNTENAQGVEGHGNEWVETGFVINNAVDNSLSITTGSIVGAQKLANSVANTTYEVVTEIPVLHNLGRLTGAVSIADNFMKFRQNPSENWWNGVECVGQIGFYFCGGGEAEIIFNLGTMGIDAGIELWNYSTQPQLNSNKK